ncbi:MAG: transporter substrate-binding domain-containing protein [Betaproteobacteria bacterium]|jgi:general L-amino acid transport system substrate-binding protein
MQLRSLLAAAVGLVLGASSVQAGEVLNKIKADGKLVCIVNPNSPGFSVPDSKGVFQGFNVEFCRMAAAAIFGDASKVELRGVGFSDSLKTLVAGGAHMASRSITRTGTRDTDPALSFIATTFYDGQGFMVPRSLKVNRARDLNGATVCAEDGSTTLLNLADWFSKNNLKYKVENIADKSARLQAFFTGKCDVMSSDFSALASDRLLSPRPDDYVILPDVISNEPLTLVSRPDKELEAAVFWGLQVMLLAEEFGITSANVDGVVAKLASQPKDVQRLFAPDQAAADMAKKMGISPRWAYAIIKSVGNYAEVFERHLGKTSALKMDRAASPNRLVRDGGLLYAHPIR